MPRKIVSKHKAVEEEEVDSEAEAQKAEDDGISNEEFDKVLNEFGQDSSKSPAEQTGSISPRVVSAGIAPSAGVLTLFAFALPATFAFMLFSIFSLKEPVAMGVLGGVFVVTAALLRTALTATAKNKFRSVVKAGKSAAPAAEACWFSAFANSAAYSVLFAFVYTYVFPSLVTMLELPLENPYPLVVSSLLAPAATLFGLSKSRYRLF